MIFGINDIMYNVTKEERMKGGYGGTGYAISYREGWVCPKCGRVYSPNQPMCLYCGADMRGEEE